MVSMRIPMKKRRKPWLLLVGLGLLAGCTGEESNPAPPVVPAPASHPVTSATGSAAPTTGKPAAGTTDTKAPASSPAESKDSAAPSLEGPKSDAGPGDGKAVKLTDSQLANIKKLPAGEQEAALKQLVCPISGEQLGSMGMPFKVSALDRTFYLCCKGCEDDVKSDPKGAIAKLDKK
jgi:hypothetical protein